MVQRALEKLKAETTTELTKIVIVSLSPHLIALASLSVRAVRQTFLSLPQWLQLGVLASLVLINSVVVVWALLLRERLRKATLQSDIPTRTIAILPRHEPSEYYWSLEDWHNKSTMHLTARFIVTNLTNLTIRLSGATTRKAKGHGWVMVKHSEQNLYGWYDIPAHETTIADVEIWASPPVKNEGECFVSDVALYDQFGNEHWVNKQIEFTYGPS